MKAKIYVKRIDGECGEYVVLNLSDYLEQLTRHDFNEVKELLIKPYREQNENETTESV